MSRTWWFQTARGRARRFGPWAEVTPSRWQGFVPGPSPSLRSSAQRWCWWSLGSSGMLGPRGLSNSCPDGNLRCHSSACDVRRRTRGFRPHEPRRQCLDACAPRPFPLGCGLGGPARHDAHIGGIGCSASNPCGRRHGCRDAAGGRGGCADERVDCCARERAYVGWFAAFATSGDRGEAAFSRLSRLRLEVVALRPSRSSFPAHAMNLLGGPAPLSLSQADKCRLPCRSSRSARPGRGGALRQLTEPGTISSSGSPWDARASQHQACGAGPRFSPRAMGSRTPFPGKGSSFSSLSSSASSALPSFALSKVRRGSAPPPFITGSWPFHFSSAAVLKHGRGKRVAKDDVGLGFGAGRDQSGVRLALARSRAALAAPCAWVMACSASALTWRTRFSA